MTDLRAEKALVLDHYADLAKARPGNVAEILAERTAADWLWRGMHPFGEVRGAAAVAETFWQPFLTALSRPRRRQDVFIAGKNQIGGFRAVWTISMGHLLGLFDAPFLGIPPTRKIAMLRYAEFNRIEDGRIAETALFFDLLHLIRQAGIAIFPDQTGQHLVQPGPMTHDGVILGVTEPAEGKTTLALTNAMLGDIARNSNDGSGRAPYDAVPRDELRRRWHDDMIWWGPEGIGATYTIDRYVEQHQRPFRTGLTNRVFNGHICRLAEGCYGGFFGWPNLTLTNNGGYLGRPAGGVGDMRVVDIYRREADRLAENWVFIDMLHFLLMQGRDVLAEIAAGGIGRA